MKDIKSVPGFSLINNVGGSRNFLQVIEDSLSINSLESVGSGYNHRELSLLQGFSEWVRTGGNLLNNFGRNSEVVIIKSLIVGSSDSIDLELIFSGGFENSGVQDG